MLRESRHNFHFASQVCGFVDDDPAKRGRFIQGSPVLGAGRDLESIVRKHRIQEVLIAIPSARGPDMRRIVEFCRAAGVSFRTMPGISEIVSDKPLGRQLREVAVADLLGRTTIQMDRQQIEAKLRGRVALVTGAAGSIGSELLPANRRLPPGCPGRLRVYPESALFHIERELRAAYPDLILHAEIGSAQNRQRLTDRFFPASPADCLSCGRVQACPHDGGQRV